MHRQIGPMTYDDASRELGKSHAATYLDQCGEDQYKHPREALAAYLVNLVDTARELRLYPEGACVAFLETCDIAGTKGRVRVSR